MVPEADQAGVGVALRSILGAWGYRSLGSNVFAFEESDDKAVHCHEEH